MEPERASEPAVVIMRSAVSMLSLMSTGMPCSGPRGPFSCRSLSSASAIASASGFSSMMALIAGPRLSISSMRSRYFSAIDRAVYRPDFIPACNSATVVSSSSNGFTAAGVCEGSAEDPASAVALPSRLACKNVRRFIRFQYASRRSTSRARSSTCGRIAFSNCG